MIATINFPVVAAAQLQLKEAIYHLDQNHPPRNKAKRQSRFDRVACHILTPIALNKAHRATASNHLVGSGSGLALIT